MNNDYQEELRKEKDRFTEWVKRNKWKLIISGISAIAVIGLILGIKNRKEIACLWDSLIQRMKDIDKDCLKLTVVENVDSTVITDTVDVGLERVSKAPHKVITHIRNLPEGWRPSQLKLDEAAERGIALVGNQTLVDAYSTGRKVA